MGQVYQATDTKLNRQVALKILPEAFAADPDRLARFQREAQVLASLNHPNIAQIHGLEESEGTRALVLELVEGPTLEDRIAQGPIPVDEALPIAKQIAEALEAAHEAGVIHRDLKPANIKVREDGTVKVLDFGLARALQPDPSSGDASQSPTLTAAATQAGVILGTAAYMAPEQAKGRTVDKRADIWAFGAVLYEMLTGRRAFGGGDVSDTLAMVLMKEVDWSLLPADTPGSVRRLLERCLARDPKQRIRDIGDVQLAMEGAFETRVGTAAEPTVTPQLQLWQRPVPAVLVLFAVAAIASLAVWTMTGPVVTPAEVMRFAIVPPDTAPLDLRAGRQDLVISRDGADMIYTALPDATGSTSQLYRRPIDQFAWEPLRGTEGGIGPFVSPNGESVGFIPYSDQATLQKVSIFGGPPVTVTESPNNIYGASWGTDNQIIFGTLGGGLFRVSGGGGEPESLTTLDTDQAETGHGWPFIIPDRNAVAFVIFSSGSMPLLTGQLAVLDLDTGEVRRLGLAGVGPHHVSTEHLVYADADGSVRAVPFDAATLEVTGNPVLLVEGVVVKGSGAADFSISDDGRLVYVSGSDRRLERSFVWVDRDGQEEAVEAAPKLYQEFTLSPGVKPIPS